MGIMSNKHIALWLGCGYNLRIKLAVRFRWIMYQKMQQVEGLLLFVVTFLSHKIDEEPNLLEVS